MCLICSDRRLLVLSNLWASTMPWWNSEPPRCWRGPPDPIFSLRITISTATVSLVIRQILTLKWKIVTEITISCFFSFYLGVGLVWSPFLSKWVLRNQISEGKIYTLTFRTLQNDFLLSLSTNWSIFLLQTFIMLVQINYMRSACYTIEFWSKLSPHFLLTIIHTYFSLYVHHTL